MEEQNNTLPIERIKRLSAVRQEVLGLPPEKTIQRILEEPHPAALVHSFPEEDFYFLLHGIGPDDAGPLLKLANEKQWEYVLDHDIWHRDRIQMPSATLWLNLLTKADPQRLVRWVYQEKSEFIKLFLHHVIEVKVREHDQDPSELGKDFHTFDDVYYYRFLPAPPDPWEEEKSGLDREKVITRLLDFMADHDHARFQTFLLESGRILPAEAEEELFRQRNVRLAEKGFLPFDEAIGVYQSLRPEDLARQSQKTIRHEPDAILDVQVPQVSAEMLEDDNLFTRGLRAVASEDILFQLQAEFAGLCNRLLSADQMQVRDREQLRVAVQKASGYIHIGLSSLIDETDRRRAGGRAARILERYSLIHLFRIGFGQVLALKWSAEQWRRESWFERAGLPLSFWDEDWIGVLGGLFLKKPLFFDRTATGQRYREFRTETDVDHTAAQLNGIIALDHLFSRMDTRIAFKPGQFLTHKKLILTLWARRCLGLDAVGTPAPTDPSLSLAEFTTFFKELFSDASEGHPLRRKHIGGSMKTAFLEWTSEKSGMTAAEISETLGIFFENIFQELEEELGEVPSDGLDPRFVSLFLVRPETDAGGPESSN